MHRIASHRIASRIAAVLSAPSTRFSLFDLHHQCHFQNCFELLLELLLATRQSQQAALHGVRTHIVPSLNIECSTLKHV